MTFKYSHFRKAYFREARDLYMTPWNSLPPFTTFWDTIFHTLLFERSPSKPTLFNFWNSPFGTRFLGTENLKSWVQYQKFTQSKTLALFESHIRTYLPSYIALILASTCRKTKTALNPACLAQMHTPQKIHKITIPKTTPP